jgi:nicotinamidase-related amidase
MALEDAMQEALIVGRPAVLVIDMQKDFVDGSLPSSGAAAITPRIARLLAAARAVGVPVIYTQELHRPGRIDAGLEAEQDPEHCVEGTPGTEIVAELAPQPGDHIVAKRRFSAFLGTDLEILLRGLGVDTLLVTGMDTGWCVLWTSGDAFQYDHHVRVVEDCVACVYPETHEAALTILRALTQRPVETVDEAVAALEEYGRAGRGA